MGAAWLKGTFKNTGSTSCSKKPGTNWNVRKTAASSRRPATAPSRCSDSTAWGISAITSGPEGECNRPQRIDEVRVTPVVWQLRLVRQLPGVVIAESDAQLAVVKVHPRPARCSGFHDEGVLLH